MKRKHIAFVVESSYGHLIPTLGIAAELIRNGHRVSYAVKQEFTGRIHAIGAEVMVYQPLENKVKLFHEMKRAGNYRFTAELTKAWRDLRQEEIEDTLAQLKTLYSQDKPDLIVYDRANPAGRPLAVSSRTATAEHSPLVISKESSDWSYDENIVVVSIPRFFQRNPNELDDRFHFVGFIPNERRKFFVPWKQTCVEKKVVLVSATTGLLPQVQFLKNAIAAFADSPYKVVVSAGNVPPSALEPLPANCELNLFAANIEILEMACLFVGQAGQGSVLEALYSGVPQLLVPPALRIFDDSAVRVAELGLGLRLLESEGTPENLNRAGMRLLEDEMVRSRLQEISMGMRAENGAKNAAELLSNHI